MPVTPNEGESREDFMSRCISSMEGEENAEATCAAIWADHQGGGEQDSKKLDWPGIMGTER